MFSKDVTFHSPTQVAEVVELLGEYGDRANILAGGMSMLPMLNLGLLRPDAIVSLNRVQDLEYIEEDAGTIRIGARTRHAQIERDPIIAASAPVLSEAAAAIGDVQVRHRGTIGGSLAHADPAADYAAATVALDARFKLTGPNGSRVVRAREFFVDFLMTLREPTEVLVEVEIPKPAAKGAYVRLARVEGSFAIVNAAALVNEDKALIAIGGATPAPVVVDLARDDGQELLVERVATAAYDACEDTILDPGVSGEYRRSVAGSMARRAVEQATREEP